MNCPLYKNFNLLSQAKRIFKRVCAQTQCLKLYKFSRALSMPIKRAYACD